MSLLADTLTGLFQKRITANPKRVAYQRKINGVWEDTTWEEYRNFVEEICFALIDLGIQQGDRVAILSMTRMEWAFADVGILSAGGVTVPIYPSNLAPDVAYVLKNSSAKAVFVEDEQQLQKVLSSKPNLPELQHIILIEDNPEATGNGSYITLKELCQKGRHYKEAHKPDFLALLEKPSPQDTATIVYTSGTTGMPKGVVLTHENFISELVGISKIVPPITEEDKVLTFLPYAHIFARAEHYLGMVYGWTAAYAEGVPQLIDNLAEARPTLMFCVPRIYEKVYTKILGQVLISSPLKQKIFYWSLKVGKLVSERIQKRQALTPLLSFKYALAKKLVFDKLKAKFGGRLRFFVSAGAPLSGEIAAFFHAAGFLILEAYGLTETTGAVFANRSDDYEFATVGKPLDDVKVKIAEDGEILVKSKKVFKGYHQNPEATAKSFIDGWFYTGDIGHINKSGNLKITDRKKDIIVTSAGKNIAPQKIESLMKTDPYISQVMVYGDKRNYLTALITIDADQVSNYAESNGIKINGNLTEHPEILKLIQLAIKTNNEKLPSYETIKKFKILKDDFTVENGELTPSLKVKRKYCTEKYRTLLDSMYV